MVWMKFQGKLEFREDLPVSEIERITDPINGHVLVLHCRNNERIITINDETLCVWKDRESCYFFREDGEWNPMMSVDMAKSTDATHAITFLSPNPPQRLNEEIRTLKHDLFKKELELEDKSRKCWCSSWWD